MAVKLAPVPRQQYVDSSGNPYSGAKLFYYAAGTTTKQNTYTTSVGDVANTNPIVLDSSGRTPYGVWLTEGVNYKVVLSPSTDTDPPASPIFTEDVITGINSEDTASQWVASGSSPTYVSATQFTVAGDKTGTFLVDRRVKCTVTAGTVYGYISASAYTTLTTVTVVLDSGSLDSGLSAVEVGILTDTNSAIPLTVAKRNAANNYTNAQNEAKGSDVASAATINLTTATGNLVHVTGTTTITAITLASGAERTVVFDGSLTLTHNATTLILPDAANIQTAAGDKAVFRGDGSGNTRCISYERYVRKGSDVASAATVNLDAATGDFVHITGTTTITAITLASGRECDVVFDGALTLTHNATTLILPSAANITTAAGDRATFRGDGSGNARCIHYTKASGLAVLGSLSKVTVFDASDTWTKASTSTFVMVEAWGGGGGGASGRRGAAGSTRTGGTGGSGGSYVLRLFKASDLGATETVTIGAGGSVGAAVTANDTNGNAGGNGGNTTFGSWLTAYGGIGGIAGSASPVAGPGGAGVLAVGTTTTGGAPTSLDGTNTLYGQFGGGIGILNADGGASGFGGGAGGAANSGSTARAGGCSYQGGPGGGAGGSISSGDASSAGGAGGSATGASGGGGAGGAAGANGTAGTGRQGGGGGGGGGAGVGGTGGAGGQPGSGGGGGGASLNGNNSGAGGLGGAGRVIVYEW